MMRKLALVFVGACAMAVVSVAASSGAGGAGPRDAVWGGGHFEGTIASVTFIRDFSVIVEQGRFGGGDGTFVYGRNGFFGSVNTPSCIAVSGNRAVIGGKSQAGQAYLWYAVDNGTPASAVRDAVTPLLLLEPGELAQMPTGFPKVCPSPDSVIGGAPYFDLTGGDIVIRDVI
jgi:hypothetical protein